MSLQTAIKAGIPIIACTFRDILHLPEVMAFMNKGKKITDVSDGQTVIQAHKDGVLYSVGIPNGVKLKPLYTQMLGRKQSLVIVNPEKPHPAFFDIGELPVPKQLIRDQVDEIAETHELAKEIMKALGGCTIKESVEYMRLAMAETGELSAKSVVHVRKLYFQAQAGLTAIDTAGDFYMPNAELSAWIEKEQQFFLTETDHRLIPRGLLLDGPPGTGKTSAAKEIARRWGVSLYRIDIAGQIDKYQGVSEKQFMSSIARLDNEEPCVVLIDEIEKVFPKSEHDFTGTKSGLKSQMLWWLAEHRSRVLVIMTTNNKEAIQKELYRPGRIDKVFYLGGLEIQAAKNFGAQVAQQFPKKKLSTATIEKAVTKLFEEGFTIPNTPTVSHAAVTEAIYSAIKN